VQPTAKFIKKYLILPGYVISKGDGQRCYLTGPDLIKLYGVAPAECVVDRDDYMPMPGRKQPGREGLIVLGPRHDGAYRTPEGKPNYAQ